MLIAPLAIQTSLFAFVASLALTPLANKKMVESLRRPTISLFQNWCFSPSTDTNYRHRLKSMILLWEL